MLNIVWHLKPVRFSGFVLMGMLALFPFVDTVAQSTTVAQDMAAAAQQYAAKKAEEKIKEQCKRTIIASYKKIYGSGANKQLVRTLGNVALSAEEIDTLASNMAKATLLGDPEGVKAVGQQVAVALGKQLLPGISDPKLRAVMGDLLGDVEKTKEISEVVGQAAGGDSRPMMELIGRTVIAVTPAAAIFAAGETAVGVMKYANQKFSDSSLEDLYSRYAKGDADDREQVRVILESQRLYSYIIRDRRMELVAEKAESIRNATAEPSDKVRQKLEYVSEKDVIDNIMQNFAARAERERLARVSAAASEQAREKATLILDALNTAAYGQWGKNWAQSHPYNLERYIEVVQERLQNDGVLDPESPRDIAAMSRLLSTRLVYGADSEEYRQQLAGFEHYKQTLQGNFTAAQQDAPELQNDGSYSGSFSGGAGGTLQFQVFGSRVSGSLSGAYKGRGFVATFSGTINADGTFTAVASGDFTSKASYPFTGRIGGSLVAGKGSGSWAGSNKWAGAQGSWRAQR